MTPAWRAWQRDGELCKVIIVLSGFRTTGVSQTIRIAAEDTAEHVPANGGPSSSTKRHSWAQGAMARNELAARPMMERLDVDSRWTFGQC